MEPGFGGVTLDSAAGGFSTRGGGAATLLGFATRLIFALGLGGCFFLSKIISTAISGFSSAGGSGESGSGFESLFADAFSFGFATALSGVPV